MPTDPTVRSAAARFLCFATAAAIVFSLFYLGAKPGAGSLFPPPWDKAAHLVVYSSIAALLWGATAGRMRVAVVLVVIAIGALDELHQAALPGRSADWMDFLTDTCAVTVTIGVLAAWARWRGPAGANRKEQPCAA
jgi:VanZ family protein